VESAAISRVSAAVRATSTREPDLLRLSVSVQEPIPAGSVLQLNLSLVPTAPPLGASGITFSTISFLATEIGRRDTRMLSTADLTPSGTQIMTKSGSI
jgi:hypothetical protein